LVVEHKPAVLLAVLLEGLESLHFVMKVQRKTHQLQRHPVGRGAAPPRHLAGHGAAPPRHPAGHGAAPPRHLAGHGAAPPRHPVGRGAAPPRHLVLTVGLDGTDQRRQEVPIEGLQQANFRCRWC